MENLMEAFGVTDDLQIARRIEVLEREVALAKVGGEDMDDATTFVAGVAMGVNSNGVGKTGVPGIPKNHRPSVAHAGRTYVRKMDRLEGGGNVPQQQADIADILRRGMERGVVYSEEYVFALVIQEAVKYPSLRNSKQFPDYLFRFYRGVKKDKTIGFVARGFLQQIG